MPGSTRRLDPKPPGEEHTASPGSARIILICVGVLFALSLTMLFSIGIGQTHPLHYPIRQLIYGIVAALGCTVTYFVPTGLWRKGMPAIFGLSVILLIMARLVGRNVNAAHRWLSLGPVNFQPSELAKLAAILWLAWYLTAHRRRCGEFIRGFVWPSIGLGILCGGVLIGPDFGTTMLIGATGVLLMYIGGTRFFYLLCGAVTALSGLWLLIREDEERLSRITSFLHPEEYANDDAYQLMGSLHAFIEGGLRGKGIGESLQKQYYLPEAHTDFILAILAEEFGLIGTSVVILMFVGIFFAGLRISIRCRDNFARMLGLGITILITLQAGINIGVVTGSMPTKGLPLPFVSYGGSSLVFMSGMVGILLRLSRGDAAAAESKSSLRESQQWI